MPQKKAPPHPAPDKEPAEPALPSYRRLLLALWTGRDRWRGVAIVALVAWVVLAAFPPGPAPAGTELDPSWVLGLNLAHRDHLVAGRDIIWTYGPLGALSLPDPVGGQMWSALAYRLGMYFLWAAALFRLRRRPWIVLVFGLVLPLEPFLSGNHLEVALYAFSALVLIDGGRWRTVELCILAALAATALLVKVSVGLQAVCMLAGVSLAILARERHTAREIAAAFAVWLATLAGLYWASTGDLSALPLYLRNSLEISLGYSETMSWPGPLWQVFLAVLGLACLLIPPLVQRRREVLPVWPAVALCAFFVFKNSFVRQDFAHGVSFAPKLALTAILFCAAVKTLRLVWPAVGLQIACIALAAVMTQNWPFAWTWQRLWLDQSMAWAGVFWHWPESWNTLARQGRVNLSNAALGEVYRTTIGASSIDSVPWDVATVLANGWKWSPQPVFQSYQVDTPLLDRIDAAHLATPRAADFLLVQWKAIDGRHPFLEEPLTWQERLNHYQVHLYDRHFALFKRRAAPWTAAEVRISGAPTAIEWDRDVPVPREPGTIVHLEIDKSLLGSLRGLMYRLNPVWMDVTRQSGRTEHWRALRANLQNGVLIHDLPAGLADLVQLAEPGCRIADPVISFRMHADSPADYRQEIRLQWGQRPPEARNCAPLPQTPAFDIRTSIAIYGLELSGSRPAAPSWSDMWHEVKGVGFFALGIDEGWVRTFGRRNDIPVVGDWTGTGVWRGGVFRNGTWYLDLNNNGQWDGVEGGDALYEFGRPGDIPVVGDWNGDGTSKLGVYRGGLWVLDYSGTHRFGRTGTRACFFGLPTDIPVVSNWRHGREDRIGVFRNGSWYVDSNGDGHFDLASDDIYPFGRAGDLPVIVDWGKQGGKKIGVYRNGQWILDRDGDNRYDRDDLAFQP